MPLNSAAWIPAAKAQLEVKPAKYTSPDKHEIVVRNHAVAINPIDWLKQGKLSDMVYGWIKYPFVLGSDIAGEIVEIGSNVTRFKVGDRVISHAVGYAETLNTPTKGAFQDYTVCLDHMTCPIPDSLKYEQAAVLPLAASTAACGLFEREHLNLQQPSPSGRSKDANRQQTILIWGGATSVGCNAIQLAHAAGYSVVVTCSPKNFDLCKRLGADQCYDYRAQNIVAQLIGALSRTDFAGALSLGVNSDGPLFDVLQQCKTGKVISMIAYPSLLPEPETLKLLRSMFFFAKWFLSTILKSNFRGIRWKFAVATTIVDSGIGKMLYENFLPNVLASGDYIPAPDAEVVGHGLGNIQTGFNHQMKGMSAKKVVVTL